MLRRLQRLQLDQPQAAETKRLPKKEKPVLYQDSIGSALNRLIVGQARLQIYLANYPVFWVKEGLPTLLSQLQVLQLPRLVLLRKEGNLIMVE